MHRTPCHIFILINIHRGRFFCLFVFSEVNIRRKFLSIQKAIEHFIIIYRNVQNTNLWSWEKESFNRSKAVVSESLNSCRPLSVLQRINLLSVTNTSTKLHTHSTLLFDIYMYEMEKCRSDFRLKTEEDSLCTWDIIRWSLHLRQMYKSNKRFYYCANIKLCLLNKTYIIVSSLLFVQAGWNYFRWCNFYFISCLILTSIWSHLHVFLVSSKYTRIRSADCCRFEEFRCKSLEVPFKNVLLKWASFSSVISL